MQRKLIFLLLFFTNLLACKNLFNSSSSSESAKTPLGVAIFAKKKDLPACSKDLEKVMVFAQDEKKFFTCKGDKWVEVKVDAPKGDKGDVGDRGPSGVVSTDISVLGRNIFTSNVKGIVYIEVKFEGSSCTQYEAGSGFVVAAGVVATNGHVVKPSTTGACGSMDLKEARLWFPLDNQGNTKKNEVGATAMATKADRAIAPTDDIALLQVDTQGVPPLTLSALDEPVKVADEVILVGYSGATAFAHLTIGKINQIQPTSNIFLNTLVTQGFIALGKMVYEFDLISGGGASGAPLFALNGEVIGLNFAGNTSESDTGFGYAVQVKPLRTLLSQPRNWQDL